MLCPLFLLGVNQHVARDRNAAHRRVLLQTARRVPGVGLLGRGVRAVFGAVMLAEPEGPPALSAAGGVGDRGRRCGPSASVKVLLYLRPFAQQ